MLTAAGSSFAQEPQEYIVQFRSGTAPAARRAAAENAGAAVRVVYGRLSAVSIRVPNANALAALRQNPDVLSIVPNRQVSAFQNGQGKKPGGGSGTGQVIPKGVERIGAPTAASTGHGIGVAILDTGIDFTHADLAVSGSAFTAYGSSCQDDQGHGTHVAGIVAAGDNGIDVLGVAPGAQLYCAKVLNSQGSGTDETVLAGLDWVLERVDPASPEFLVPAIRVINMSLGRPRAPEDGDPNNPTRIAIEELTVAGVSIVAAAGNDPAMNVANQVPASYPGVISVASTTAVAGSNQCRFLVSGILADTASYFTTDGASVTISAPGEEREDVSRGCFISSLGILSTRLGGGTTRMSGTSMAAPHVAGVVARYYQGDSEANPADAQGWIVQNAFDIGAAPHNSPASSYTFDGVREGVVTAPTP
jgi:subtilisin